MSCYVTSVFATNEQVEAQGYNNGVLLYDTTNSLSDTTPTNISFNFLGVTEVDFISQLSGSPGGYLAMDNMVIQGGAISAIPQTGSLRVATFPDAANSGGALWQVDAGMPQSSGRHSEQNLQTGKPCARVSSQ